MDDAPENTLGNTFVFHGEWIVPLRTPQPKPGCPLHLVLPGQARAVHAPPNPTSTSSFSKFSLFSLSLSFYMASGGFVCVFLLLLASHPYHSPTACQAGTTIPCKEHGEEKHSLIFLCTVTCTTLDHTQRLSHSWIGPKGRNKSRKTTVLAGSAASRTPQSLPPLLQFVADLAKRGIQLQALWFK